MDWIAARLREDSTRSGLGQLAVIVLLLLIVLGVDVHALLTQAEAALGRLGALAAQVASIAALLAPVLARIATPQPARPAAEMAVEKLAELLPRPIEGVLMETQTDPGLADAVAARVIERLSDRGRPT